jgi:glycosyltransferase involved in cell wall biosynthesis
VNNRKPLVSIFTFCKNGVRSIRRCVESVLKQDYCNMEYIVQDGASTDGTLEILKEYEAKYGNRFKLVSEADGCAEVAFFRSLRRCTGEIIGSCLADEEMLPGAITWAVEHLSEAPDAGAIYGDMYLTDIEGNITGRSLSSPFDVAKYLCHEISPPFAASFFRRTSLEAIGLYDREWMLRAGESELWIRLGLKFPVYHFPGFVTKYAVHPGQLSSQSALYNHFLPSNIELLDRLYAEPGTLDDYRFVQQQAYAGVYLWIGEILWGLGAISEAKKCLKAAGKYKPNHETFERVDGMIGRRNEKRLRLETQWLEAKMFEQQGALERAYRIYRLLSHSDHPRQWLAYYRYGSLAQRTGRQSVALQAFRRVVDDVAVAIEHRASAAYHLGELALEAQEQRVAVEWFTKALNWNPMHLAAADRIKDLSSFQ